MGIYLAIVIFLIGAIVYTTDLKTGEYTNSSQNYRKPLFYLAVVLLVLIQAFRTDTVGGDLKNYWIYYYGFGDFVSFSDIIMKQAFTDTEVGYNLLCKILYILFCGNYNLFLGFIALVFHASLARFISFFSQNIFFSLFIFITVGAFNISMNNLRSTVMLAIMFQSIIYLYKKNYRIFWITLMFAGLFHRTAWAFSLFFLFHVVKSNKTMMKLSMMFIVTEWFLGNYLLLYLAKLFPRYSYYLQFEPQGGYNLLLFVGGILLLVWCNYKEELLAHSGDGVFCFFYKMLLCGFILQVFAVRMPFFVRVVQYYLYSLCIIIPAVFKINKTLMPRPVLAMGIIVFFCGFYYYLLCGNMTQTVPYVTIFHKM